MALQKGSEGFAVTNLQKNLTQIGLQGLVADGKFGPQTFIAVEAFQSAHSLPVNGIVDEDTYRAITKALVNQLIMPGSPAPWVPWLKSHIGEPEKTGAPATDFDKEVFSHTSYENLTGMMEPGCAATACAALEENGFKSPHNAAAESFRNFGIESELKPGAIVGFNWSGKKGIHCDHVSFCDHIIDQAHVACLGGNQGHEVKVSVFSRNCIDFVRWPLEKLDPVKLASPVGTTIRLPDPVAPVKKPKGKADK